MHNEAAQFSRQGVIHCDADLPDVFPLLCPKREEDWIPGWECETLWSRSGYNEEGAIFRTTKPYGTELYWTTLRYGLRDGAVDFLVVAPRLFMLRFTIDVSRESPTTLALRFTQVFTAVSDEGLGLLARYRTEDYGERLKTLETLLARHLSD